METRYLRALCDRAAAVKGSPGDPIRFVASTEDIARDGLIIEATGWQLANYLANPVVLWCHDYRGDRLPIGKGTPSIDGDQLVADVVFDQADEFARQVEQKYRGGFLNAVSVGWNTLEMQPGKGRERGRVTKADLLDISAVPVPADAKALKERRERGLRNVLQELVGGDLSQLETIDLTEPLRGAIPPHTSPKAPEDTGWDGPAEVAKCPAEEAPLRRMHAWVNGDADPNLKSSYKLPHHLAGGEVVWRGVAAAMARLLQSGTVIPDDDRKGVYNHLERHYKQFDKTAPEFRPSAELDALSDAEIRGQFLEGEEQFLPDPVSTEFDHQRVGAVLSARNRADLEQAVGLIQGVLKNAEKPSPEDKALEHTAKCRGVCDSGRALGEQEMALIQKCMDMLDQMKSMMSEMMSQPGEKDPAQAEPEERSAQLSEILTRMKQIEPFGGKNG